MKVITPDFMKKFYNKLATIFAKKQHSHTKSQITDFPTAMPASDVSSWAKSNTKPTYTKSEVGLGNVDNTADANKSVKYATSAGSASSASKATGVVDYRGNNKTIQIGYSGDGISGNDIKYIAGYTAGDGSDVDAKIKDVSKDALKSWLGLGSLAYSSATIPTIPPSLPANGGNSTTVNGHTVNSNVPSGAKFTDTTYSIYDKAINSKYATAYRTQTKGNNNSGSYIATIRSEEDGTGLPIYSAGLAWGRGDTHGYLNVDYNSQRAFLGGGNADKLNWIGQIAFTNNIPSLVNNLTTTGAGHALDARQGKALNDSINSLSSRINSTEKQGMVWTRVNPSKFGIGFWHEHCKVDFASSTKCYLRSTYPIILYIVPNPKVINNDNFYGLYYIIDAIRAIGSKDISSTTVSTFRKIGDYSYTDVQILPSGKSSHDTNVYGICVQPLSYYSYIHPLYKFLSCYNYNNYSFSNCDQFNFAMYNNTENSSYRNSNYTNGNPNCLEAYVLHPANIKTVTFTN